MAKRRKKHDGRLKFLKLYRDRRMIPGLPPERKGRSRTWLIYIDTLVGPLKTERTPVPVGFLKRTRHRDAAEFAREYWNLKPNQSVHLKWIDAKQLIPIRKRQRTAVIRGLDASFAACYAKREKVSGENSQSYGKRPPFPKRVLANLAKKLNGPMPAPELPLGDDFSPTASVHSFADRVLAQNRK